MTRVVQNALVLRLLIQQLLLVLEGGKLGFNLAIVTQLVLRATLDDLQSLHILIEQLFLVFNGRGLSVQSRTVVRPRSVVTMEGPSRLIKFRIFEELLNPIS